MCLKCVCWTKHILNMYKCTMLVNVDHIQRENVFLFSLWCPLAPQLSVMYVVSSWRVSIIWSFCYRNLGLYLQQWCSTQKLWWRQTTLNNKFLQNDALSVQDWSALEIWLAYSTFLASVDSPSATSISVIVQVSFFLVPAEQLWFCVFRWPPQKRCHRFR